MIYLDSAAVVKLVHAQAESAALRAWLDERSETGWISSVLTEIESFRALARYAPSAVSRLPAVLDLIDPTGPARPHPGPDRPTRHRPQPGRHPPWHRPARPRLGDLLRNLRQAPARGSKRGRPSDRLTRLVAQRPPGPNGASSQSVLLANPSGPARRKLARHPHNGLLCVGAERPDRRLGVHDQLVLARRP